MKGLILCLIVIVAVDAVRSQAGKRLPTRTKKGKRLNRPNDNPDYGMPSGADFPDNRLLKARRPGSHPPGPHPPRFNPPGSAAKPALGRAPVAAVAPAAHVPRRSKTPVRTGPPPPKRRPVGTRTRTGLPPASQRAHPVAGRRNDNPDYGVSMGRDFPDAGHFPYAPAPVAPAPPAPVYDCQYFCQFDGNKPVCSIFGTTYENDCYRNCQNEPRDCENACPCNVAGPVVPGNPFPSSCNYCYNDEHSPVCVDGEEEYFNQCLATCKGKTVTCTDSCAACGP